MINILNQNQEKLLTGLTIDDDFFFDKLELRTYDKLAKKNIFLTQVIEMRKRELELEFQKERLSKNENDRMIITRAHVTIETDRKLLETAMYNQ